jgi:asparagine synthase (glutamine-hydrolysing)
MAGVSFALDPASDRALEARRAMLAALAHRGRRRDERQLEGAALGIVHEGDGSLWADRRRIVLADARLDNREELRATLDAAPTASDAELFALAHDRWPNDFPARFLGDFAVLIWEPGPRRLTMSRDALGVRCLYWHRRGLALRVATEPLVVARSAGSLAVDREQCALFLVGEYDEREGTLLQEVRSVPPAHVLVVDEDGREVRRRFWSVTDAPVVAGSSAELAEMTRALLRSSVRARLADGGPAVAAEFSGGVDSTSVAAIAAGIAEPAGRPRIQGVTRVFPGLDCDESWWSRAVAVHLGIPLIEVAPLAHPEELSPSAPAHASGAVYFHPTVAMTWPQLRVLRAQGISVVLTGFGSDQLAHRMPAAELLDDLRSDGTRALARSSPRFALSTLGDRWLGLRRMGRLRRMRRRSFLSPRFAVRVDELQEQRIDALRRRPHRDEVQLALALALEHRITRQLANLDRAAARAGVERRHPFLDLRVVNALVGMPHPMTAGRGSSLSKPLLRQAMETLLPREVLRRRSKTIFDSYARAVLTGPAASALRLARNGPAAHAGVLDDAFLRSTDPTDPNGPLRPILAWLGLDTWLRSLESHGGPNV